MTKKTQRRTVWILIALIGVGPFHFDGLGASGRAKVIREVVTGPAAERLVAARMAANPRVRGGREWARARRLHDGLPKSALANRVAVVRWAIDRGRTNNRSILAALTSLVSDEVVLAAGDCPIEVGNLLRALRPQMQRVDHMRDDPCAGIDEVYEYYDVYQDGSAPDAFGVDVGIVDHRRLQHLSAPSHRCYWECNR